MDRHGAGKVASALCGTVDIVTESAELIGNVTALVAQAMGRATADVALRLWTPRTASVAFVRQVAPTIADLTQTRLVASGQVVDYPIGAWGDESRDYHLRILVKPVGLGEEMLAARVSVVVGDKVVSQTLLRAIGTTDAKLLATTNPAVAHYRGFGLGDEGESAPPSLTGIRCAPVGSLLAVPDGGRRCDTRPSSVPVSRVDRKWSIRPTLMALV